MSLIESWHLLRRAIAAPERVGAVLPSSRWLASALTAPFSRRQAPARVLEVGAGTGPVTRRLARLLGPADRLDICEVDAKFVRLLQRTVLAAGPLAHAHAQGRVRLLHCPVQDIEAADRYDYVISGVPLNALASGEVETILNAIERSLRPGGVFSYFEYVGARRLLSVSPDRRARRRIRAINRVLNRRIRSHQVARRVVLANIPPAHARHWRFEPAGEEKLPEPAS
jgi:phospholipid N-methyltransferase